MLSVDCAECLQVELLTCFDPYSLDTSEAYNTPLWIWVIDHFGTHYFSKQFADAYGNVFIDPIDFPEGMFEVEGQFSVFLTSDSTGDSLVMFGYPLQTCLNLIVSN